MCHLEQVAVYALRESGNLHISANNTKKLLAGLPNCVLSAQTFHRDCNFKALVHKTCSTGIDSLAGLHNTTHPSETPLGWNDNEKNNNE